MNKNFVCILVFMASFSSNFSQKAKIYDTTLVLKSYLFSDPDPVPEVGKLYPYFRFDGYTNRSIEKAWKMIILENDYIKVFICPEIGGKIWGAVEKSTGKEFMYFNNVVKFRDVALRGPWTSGGLEYNFGDLGHDPNGATPVNYILKNNPNGSVSCVIGASDLVSGTKWNVEVIVFKDKAFFETKTSWFNKTTLPCTYYHWMTAAAKAKGNLQFLFPGNVQIGHGGEYGNWPTEGMKDISFYENNDFGLSKSYHVINSYSDYFGGYWHDDGFGFGHQSGYDDKPGKKIWIWGLSQHGMIWEDILTDKDGQYIEYQSGKLLNQGAFSSIYTPFKHREFYPHDTDIMHEIWFPLVNTGGMVAASEFAVLNVGRENDIVNLNLSALQNLDDDLKISHGNQTLNFKIRLQPIEIFKTSFRLKDGDKFRIELGDKKLLYSSDESDLFVDRPVRSHPEFNWNSSFGLYTQGIECEKQRMYSEALPFYLKCIEKDPFFLPALDRTALEYFRMMEYDSTISLVLKSLSIDTYDPLANYLFGVANLKKGEFAKAKNGFSIAAQSMEYRVASLTELSKIFLAEKNFSMASSYAQKALNFNRNCLTALEVLELASRSQGDMSKALDIIRSIEEIDPTSIFAGFEKVVLGITDIKAFNNKIQNELKHETYLDLAISYFNYGFINESVKVLQEAPNHPVVWLWLAYIVKENQNSFLNEALSMPVAMIFPHREETARILEYFLKKQPSWKLQYYLSLIYWSKGQIEKAKNLMASCEDEPDEYIYYLANVRLFRNENETKLKSLIKARALNKSDWRVDLEWIDHCLEIGDFENGLRHSEIQLKKHPEISRFGLKYAKLLLGIDEYDKAIKFLEGYNIIPNEGSFVGRNLYHEICIRAAYHALKKGKYKNAIIYANKAKIWLPNLGVGKPYDVDERLDDFIIAFAYEKLRNEKNSHEYYSRVSDYVNPGYLEESSKLLLQVYAIKKIGDEQKAESILKDAIYKYPENEYVKWVFEYIFQKDQAEETKNLLINSSISKKIYDTKFIDEEFRLTSDLFNYMH